jgi:hypothetical protein
MARAIVKTLATSVVLMSLSCLARANDADMAGSPGCGDPNAKFEVRTDSAQHPAQPDPGKAQVYFIQDDSNFASFPKPTTRAGLDGKWVGATHGNSYLSFSIDPGVHHLCASWQFAVILGKGHMTAALHFTAEPGGVYYFRVKNTFFRSDTSAITDIALNPLDSDEGQVLANRFALSLSRQKN